MPLRVISNDLTPTAPMDDIQPGIDAQQGGLLPPGYWPRAVNYRADQDIMNPFPHTYEPPVAPAPENFMTCSTSPNGWTDIKGFSCEYYSSALWCTRDGKVGPKWQESWGPLSIFSRETISAAQACCECGGGARMTIVGNPGEKPLATRRLVAPEDRLPDPKARWFEKNNFHLDVPARPLRPNQAPEDYVPLPIRQVAPQDRLGQDKAIEHKYSRYMNELHDQKQDHSRDPKGFSVRYYSVPPKDCSGAMAAASDIAMALEYGDTALLLDVNSSIGPSPPEMKPVYLNGRTLEWPTGKGPELWWAKWSGSLMILEEGRYTLNLDIGFNSMSSFKVDGQLMLTDGQCRVSKDAGTCKVKGCTWNKDVGTCTAQGAQHVLADDAQKCAAGTYQTSPVLFGCQADGGQTHITIKPAGATQLLTIPAGVKNFNIAIESDISVDIQVLDMSTNTWVVKFAGGIVNNQQRDGTYHGMGVAYSGASPAHEFAKLTGVTTSPLLVSAMSYSGNPAKVKLIWSHAASDSCPDPSSKGCEKYQQSMSRVPEWSSKMIHRYGLGGKGAMLLELHPACPLAWKAVLKLNPGGQISWGDWEPIWSMAWGQENSIGAPGGAQAWQIGFAEIDISHDGHIQEPEFLTACTSMAGAPGPAPAPAPPVPVWHNGVYLNTCLRAQVRDRVYWPKDAFAGSGFNDSPLLDQYMGKMPLVVPGSESDKGVKVPSPDGAQQWFLPLGTYDCVYASSSPIPAMAPAPTFSRLSPAPAIVNVKPIIVPGVTGGRALLQEEVPPPAIVNSMYLMAGAHCIEAMVMVTPGARHLKLTYSGEDTNKKETVIPGKLVHCDPSIGACSHPLRDSCSAYQPQCGKSPAPSSQSMGR